ncbi:UDP-glucuronosyltransferase [Rhyzopertha dominica]|nr:UDP-glucuronosyltransferase [Rhyzopertha dominica]
MSVTGKLLLLSVLSSVYSARILGIFPTPSISHQAVFQPIWRELSLRGHQVTVITPNPLKDRHLTNLTEVDASFLYEHVGTVTSTLKVKKDHWYLWKRILSSQGKTADNLLSHPAVVTLIKDKNIRFDLIIAEFLFPFMTPLAVKYGCPFIGVTSLPAPTVTYESIGNPTHPVINPDVLTTYSDDMAFWEKVDIFLYGIYMRYVYYVEYVPIFNSIVRKHFGSSVPPVEYLAKNVSIVLTNTNPVLHGARAYSPGTIEISMMSIKPK